MSRRFGMLYADGSMNLCPESQDLLRARKELESSSDDGDTQLIEVEVKVVQMFGPKEAKVLEHYVTCPTCQENIRLSKGDSQ